MNLNSMKTRVLSVALAAALAIGTLAPAAQADHGRGWGWGRRAHDRPVVIEQHSSVVGPALFGLIGGLVLGSVITHASDTYARPTAVYAPRYDYYDPYCDRTFDSFRDYDRHLDSGYDHPHLLLVMDRNTGQCVDRYQERDERWYSIGVDPRDRDGYYGDRGYSRYRDEGYYRGEDRYQPNDRYVQPGDDDDDDDGGN